MHRFLIDVSLPVSPFVVQHALVTVKADNKNEALTKAMRENCASGAAVVAVSFGR